VRYRPRHARDFPRQTETSRRLMLLRNAGESGVAHNINFA
jgi:hypothetical protein